MTKAETSTKTSDAFSPVHSPPDLPLAPLSPPDSVHELVIDRRSLSHADISFMRLRGCRVRAHGSPAPQRCWDTSVSSVPPGAPAASLSGSLCPLVRPAEPEDDDEAERTDSAVPATSFTPSAEDAALGSPFSCVALVHPLSVWKFPVLGEKESPACTALCVAGEEPAAMGPQSVPAACSVLSPLAAGSFSELQASLKYVYRMANVYAIHEALAGQTHETVSPSVQPLSSATPHGYYSLGSRRSMHHTNKQVVSAVPQVLQGLNLRNSSENGQRLSLTQFAVHHRHQMDSAVLAQLEQRPLLQTTLFAEFNYRSLTGKRKSLGMFSLTDEALGHIEKCTRQSPKEMPQETGMHSETLAGKASPPILDTSFVSGAAGSPRRLTEVRVWNQKTHGIDGISRCVDNEEDSLVVYVGMILMGWLEVVDLLGSGTFGQVFLCKDLRISGPHFVHPNMIDGEDFQYWQYSHDYIPFSDPSLPPKSDPLVAVKVVRSQDLFDQQSVLEAEMLIFVGAQTSRETGVDDAMRDGAEEEVGRSQAMGSEPSSNDPPAEDPRCASVAKIYAHGVCYGHHCIVLKRYGANLFEYIQSRDFKGLPMYHLQDIGRQILRALTLLHDTCGVVHCDVKPENVLLSLDLSTSFASPTDAELCGASCSAASSGEIGGSVVMLSGRGRRGEGAAHARNSTTINTSTGRRTWNANSSTAADGPAKENNSPSSMTPLLPLPRRMHHLSGGAVPSLRVKLIDFSSSAYKNECIYTYVQSRYYRAPEVILGAGYGPPIDLWSTGCLLAELLLGLPLLSGSSDYHQLYLMEEMLGALPSELLEKGKQTWRFFDICTEGIDRGEESAAGANGNSLDASSRGAARTRYHFLSEETFRARHGGPPVEWSKYFRYRTLRELAQKCILSEEERRLAAGRSPCGAGAPDAAAEAAQPQVKEIIDEMVRQRFLLYDVLCKMLKGNPAERITAREALEHPFFTEVPKYIMPYLSDMKGKSLFSV